MDLVGLDFEGFKDRMTFALSGGEQRKVALASTLALQPRVLLLDEPTSGLDASGCESVLKQLESVASRGVAVVVASHDESVESLADKVFVMERGRLKPCGS